MTQNATASTMDPFTAMIQVHETAAFTLTAPTPPRQRDTTGDLFGFDADDLQHWQADQVHRRRRPTAADVPDLFD